MVRPGEQAGLAKERETVKGWEERGSGYPGRQERRVSAPAEADATLPRPTARDCQTRGSQSAPREAGREGRCSG